MMKIDVKTDIRKQKTLLKMTGTILMSLILLGTLILGLRLLGYANKHEDQGNITIGTETTEIENRLNIRVDASVEASDEELDLIEESDSEQETIENLTIYLNMIDELEVRLNELVNQTGGIIGLSYYCLTTGRQIEINADQTFFGASTIKLPTHMMIAEQVQAGVLSWDQHLTVEENDWLGGSGVLQYRMNIGDELTLREVMRHAIIYSDNLAHRMLTRTLIPGFQHGHYGLDNNHWHLTTEVFNRYLNGQNPTGRMKMSSNHLTEIFSVLYRDRDQIEGYGMILEDMMNTSWTDRFATPMADGIVAHTPGWTDPYHHDSGIFFTEMPYILIVMTSGVPHAPDFISQVSDLIIEFQTPR